MFTWCNEEEWKDEYFDIDYLIAEKGSFATHEQAQADARKCEGNEGKIYVLEIE